MHLSIKNLKDHELCRLASGEVFAWDDFSDDGEFERLCALKEEYQYRLSRSRSEAEAVRWLTKILALEERGRRLGEFTCV